MQFEILNTPIRFQLYGFSSATEKHTIADVGFRLMNQMWQSIKQSNTKTTGINHWVYLADGSMFVGVELAPGTVPPAELEPLSLELSRYLKHVHIGPYQALPNKWQALKSLLAQQNETTGSPCLEIYGHHSDEPARCETTILIALQP